MFPGEVRVHADLPSASYVITKHPVRLGGPLELDVHTPRATYAELAALKPSYQAANIACGVCIAEEYLGRALEPDALFTSVVQCPTPGRFQLLRADPLLLIDACHNPQSVEAFLAAVRAVAPAKDARPTLLCAVLKDKDVRGIVDLLAAEFAHVAVTQTSSPRALCAHELSELFDAAGCEVVGEYPTVAGALSGLCGESCVACGSITLAGEVAASFA